MTRADLTYALTAVLPHEGRKGGVGLSVRTGALRAYATDGYTAGLTQVSWPQASPLDACLPVGEARDLMRFLRPSRVDEHGETVELLVADNELHVGIPGDSQVFTLQEPIYTADTILALFRDIHGLPEGYGECLYSPQLFGKFAKAQREPADRLRLYPKRPNNGKYGVALLTIGEHFIGSIAGLDSSIETDSVLASFLQIEEKAA
jgi:hypothetical protein